MNNANGDVLTNSLALRLAEVILLYNKDNPQNPVYVVADDVYAESYLQKSILARSISSIDGAEFNRPELGRMFDWSVCIVTSSKTFALPTSRIGFATTGNKKLKNALAHYRTVFSLGRVPQFNELTAVAAICITPIEWIESWNVTYQQRMLKFSNILNDINKEAGRRIFNWKAPQGGWYILLRIEKNFLPPIVKSNLAASSILLNYGLDKKESGLGFLPGELFGYILDNNTKYFTLRGSIAISNQDITNLAERLRNFTVVLRGGRRDLIVDRSLNSMYQIAPEADDILARLTY